jgi:glycosyltransferase involved in cell wall biosynthesis
MMMPEILKLWQKCTESGINSLSNNLITNYVKKIYLIELCNFEDYPIGGHLSFAKQMLKAFGSEIALIGISTGNEPVRRWIKKEIDGIEYDFFSVRKLYKKFKKPIIPDRIKYFYYLVRCSKDLRFLVNENVFIQRPEVLFAIRNLGIKNICFRSPGVGNMLVSSRFWYAKYFKGIYENSFFKNLQKVDTILASADRCSINDFCLRSKNRIQPDKIIQFPTRIDTDIFRPDDRLSARTRLNIDKEKKVIVTTGRISMLKGWKFMIDCFDLFRTEYPDSVFFFLGDGEDRSNLETYISDKNLCKFIFLKGKLEPHIIALYLNASDLYIMGSYIEGWSTSLVEAIACGIPVCTSKFSSTEDLVTRGYNGFINDKWDKNEFAEQMKLALFLPKKALIEKSVEMEKYSINHLKNDLLSAWKLK